MAPEQFNSVVAVVHPLNVTFAAAVLYAVVYVLMDKKAGVIAAILLAFCLVTSRRFYLECEVVYGYPAWQVAAVIQVVCWIAQVIFKKKFDFVFSSKLFASKLYSSSGMEHLKDELPHYWITLYKRSCK